MVFPVGQLFEKVNGFFENAVVLTCKYLKNGSFSNKLVVELVGYYMDTFYHLKKVVGGVFLLSWWVIKGCRQLISNEARKILSAFAYSLCFDNYEYSIWQDKKTGLYTLAEDMDHGFNGIKRIVAEGMTAEQLEKKICELCPFYEEPGKEVLNV